MNKINQPIGLEAAVTSIKQSCELARYGQPPNHMIIPMKTGDGRTTLLQYMSDMYKAEDVRPFKGIDSFLEYALDGTFVQLNKVFADIQANAVYKNHYEGIIAFDIAKLATQPGQRQSDVFLSKLPRVAEHATLIFFVPQQLDVQISLLMNKIISTLKDVEVVYVQSYTENELAKIAIACAEGSGIKFKRKKRAEELISEAISSNKLSTAKDAERFSRVLIKLASADRFDPVLSTAQIEKVCCSAVSLQGEEAKAYEK